jgi:hypothetical protein
VLTRSFLPLWASAGGKRRARVEQARM